MATSSSALKSIQDLTESPPSDTHSGATVTRLGIRHGSTFQAYRILHLGFTAAPFLAGLDKFGNRMVVWDKYLAPQATRITGLSPRTFMKIVGVIEMVAGLGVAVKPRVFGYVVSGWLGGIIGNLLIQRKYYDIALRDFGLALGALSLSQLARTHERRFGRSRITDSRAA